LRDSAGQDRRSIMSKGGPGEPIRIFPLLDVPGTIKKRKESQGGRKPETGER